MLRSFFLLACSTLALTLVPPAGQSQFGAKDQQGDPLPDGAVGRLGSIRWRHDSGIIFAAFAPDGKSVISVTNQGSIYFWEFPSGKELRRLASAADALFGVSNPALTTDGKTIAINGLLSLGQGKGNQRILLVQDLASGKELARLMMADSADIYDLAFTNEGKHVTTRDSKGVGRIWDWNSGKELSQFSTEASKSKRREFFGFSADGKTVLLSRFGTLLRIVDLTTGKEIANGGSHAAGTALWFTPDGKRLLVHGTNGSVYQWDVASNKEVGAILQHAQRVEGLIVSPDGRVGALRVLGSDQGDLLNGPFGGGIGGKAGAKKGGAAKKGGGFGGFNNVVHRLNLIDAASGKPYNTIALEDTVSIVDTQFSPDSKILALSTQSDDEQIKLFDVATGKLLRSLEVPREVTGSGLYDVNQWPLPTLLFSPDGKLLAKQKNRDATAIVLFDVTTGKQLRSLALEPPVDPLTPKVNPNDGKTANAKSKSKSTALRGAFSPDGSCLAVAGTGQVTVFDLATGKPRHTFAAKGARTGVWYAGADPGPILAFSPDSKLLAFADSLNSTVHLWDAVTGKQLTTFKGHISNVTAVAFAPNGHTLCSSSFDGTVLIWDVRAKEFP